MSWFSNESGSIENKVSFSSLSAARHSSYVSAFFEAASSSKWADVSLSTGGEGGLGQDEEAADGPGPAAEADAEGGVKHGAPWAAE